jgi:hypothetical protein
MTPERTIEAITAITAMLATMLLPTGAVMITIPDQFATTLGNMGNARVDFALTCASRGDTARAVASLTVYMSTKGVTVAGFVATVTVHKTEPMNTWSARRMVELVAALADVATCIENG